MKTKTGQRRKIIFVVTWKKYHNHMELFDDLEIFCASYPRFDIEVLADAFAFSKTLFENEEVQIEKKTVVRQPKPDFPRFFFWDFNYDRINWMGSRVTVIQRILERGELEEWHELRRFYTEEAIVHSLKEEVTYLPLEYMDKVATFFSLKKRGNVMLQKKTVTARTLALMPDDAILFLHSYCRI